MCANAIQKHLKSADFKGTWDKVISKWHTITVHYIGRLDEKTVFDTSIEEIAKDCGLYASGRDYSQGLSFTVWAGQMIAGFDNAVVGMKLSQTKTITIPPQEAYGDRSESKLVKVPLEQIPWSDQLKKGMQVYASNGQAFTVYAIDDKNVTIDTNPELAGKTLIFDITVTSIQ